MRAVVQRVSRGWVRVEDQEMRPISAGLVVLIGVGKGDDESDAHSEYKLRPYGVCPLEGETAGIRA